MNWVPVASRLLVIGFFALMLPQVLGFVGYRWTRRKGRLLKLATMLIPPAVFCSSAFLFWGLSAKAIRDSGEYVCGAFGAAAAFSTISGTLLHLLLGIILFLVVNFIWKRKASKLQTEQ